MEFKKKQISEIIDSNGDLIGLNDMPANDGNADTKAHGTTDQNVKMGQQPFRYDMLGRFGFTLMPFMEGKKENDGQVALMRDLTTLMYERYLDIMKYYYKNPEKLKSDYRKLSTGQDVNIDANTEYVKKIIKVVQKHFEDAFKEPEQIDEVLESSNKSLTFKSNRNNLFYITFKFDDRGRLSGVDNKWDVSFPDWFGLEVPKNMIIDYFSKKYPEYYLANDSLNEVKVVEDKMVNKKTEDEITKKSEDKDVRSSRLEKIAGLINKLEKKDIDKLINLLERK